MRLASPPFADRPTLTALPAGPDWAAHSIASPLGRSGVKNEDNFVVIGPQGDAQWLHEGLPVGKHQENWPAGHLRMAVLDGVGGHGRGGEISEWVAAQLAATPAFSSQQVMWNVLDDLHHKARAAFSADTPGKGDAAPLPGTTLLVLEVPPTGLAWLYHVGDSRLWVERGEGLELLTVDHCPSTGRALRGELDLGQWQEEVLHQNHRPISQAFGLGSTLFEPESLCTELTPLDGRSLPSFLHGMPDRRSIHLSAGSLVLLATDGLWCFDRPMPFLTCMDDLLSARTVSAVELSNQLRTAHRSAASGQRRCDNTTMVIYRRGD
jgi:serine/threonine protein phosphatase PrpC